MKRLIISHLGKRFNDNWALKDLNLEIEAGEIFVLLGPNGAGKTTTLKLIAGLLHPTQGTSRSKASTSGRIRSGPNPGLATFRTNLSFTTS